MGEGQQVESLTDRRAGLFEASLKLTRITRIMALGCIVASLPIAFLQFPWLPARVIEFVELQHDPAPWGTASYHMDRERRLGRVESGLILYALGIFALAGPWGYRHQGCHLVGGTGNLDHDRRDMRGNCAIRETDNWAEDRSGLLSNYGFSAPGNCNHLHSGGTHGRRFATPTQVLTDSF